MHLKDGIIAFNCQVENVIRVCTVYSFLNELQKKQASNTFCESLVWQNGKISVGHLERVKNNIANIRATQMTAQYQTFWSLEFVIFDWTPQLDFLYRIFQELLFFKVQLKLQKNFSGESRASQHPKI